jgi:hypothetical protein
MFETPRTRLRNLANPKLSAPHHEAERDRGCIKLIGICFSCQYRAWDRETGRLSPGDIVTGQIAHHAFAVNACKVLVPGLRT